MASSTASACHSCASTTAGMPTGPSHGDSWQSTMAASSESSSACSIGRRTSSGCFVTVAFVSSRRLAASLVRRPWLVLTLLPGRLRRYAWWLLRAALLRSSLAASAPAPAVLAHIAVAPDARGAGLGSLLVQRFVAEAEAVGKSSVRATTLAGPGGAAGFYQRSGWTLQASANDWDAERILVFSCPTHHARHEDESAHTAIE